MHAAILPYLHYDKREAGSLGRALTAHSADVGPGLRVGDKLKPNPSPPDIACFDDTAPMLNPEFAVTPNRVICLDLLHALFSGPMQRVVWHTMLAIAQCWHMRHFRVDRG